MTYYGDASSDTTTSPIDIGIGIVIAASITAFTIAAFIIGAIINRDDLVGGWLVTICVAAMRSSINLVVAV